MMKHITGTKYYQDGEYQLYIDDNDIAVYHYDERSNITTIEALYRVKVLKGLSVAHINEKQLDDLPFKLAMKLLRITSK